MVEMDDPLLFESMEKIDRMVDSMERIEHNYRFDRMEERKRQKTMVEP